MDNKYDALILFAQADIATAHRLKNDLEKYVLPKSLRPLIGGRRRVSVCIDASDENIANSTCMVCICSEALALDNKDREISAFKQTGRRIIPLVFTRTPMTDLPVIFKTMHESGEMDQALGPNFSENDKSNRETLRTLACILNIGFRTLREVMRKRACMQRIISVVAAIMIVLIVGYLVDAQVIAATKSTSNTNTSCIIHTYTAETCTKSAVCTKCGRVAEGSEPLCHNWIDGICSRCGVRQILSNSP